MIDMGRPQEFNEENIIDKALYIFWQKGFQAASTRDLIEATGISNGSFFNSFGDKKKLYFRCLQKYDAVYIMALENLLKKPIPFKEKIKQVLHQATRKSPGKESYQGCFLFNTSIDQGIDDADILNLAKDMNERIENAFVSAVEMAKENNDINPHIKSIPFAQYLFNIVTGLRALLLNSPPKSAINNIINSTLEFLPV
jgi:TetR/AcrR family transcriptional repressor of nem operon